MKNKILNNLLEQGYRAEKQFVADLSEEERRATGSYEKWTAKDMLAHVVHWKNYHAENLLESLKGQPHAQIENGEQANEQVYSQYRDQSWTEIEALVERSYEQMKKALTALGDEELERSDLFSWQNDRPLWRIVVGNIYSHPIIHLSEWQIKKGNPARAAEMYREMTGLLSDLDESPEWQGTIRYNNACSYSIIGEKEEAIRELDEALKLNPALKEWSQQDPDLEPLREEAGFQALVA